MNERLIKNGDIIFDGVHTRDELTKQAFAKLQYLEDVLEFHLFSTSPAKLDDTLTRHTNEEYW